MIALYFRQEMLHSVQLDAVLVTISIDLEKWSTICNIILWEGGYYVFVEAISTVIPNSYCVI